MASQVIFYYTPPIMKSQPLRICLVDMNNGVANQATRCFRRIVDAFKVRVRAANPDLDVVFKHVQPRNLAELPEEETDLTLSSGGPGSPFDGYEDPWCVGYRRFLDRVVERNLSGAPGAPQALLICHSFELAVIHFQVAVVQKRPEGRKFGVMPIYPTDIGRKSVLFEPFGDRLFSFENRFWEAANLDVALLGRLGGRVLACESRRGRTDKGNGVLALDFAPGVSGTQFHPEADLAGVLSWVYRPEVAEEFKQAYGVSLYERMIKTLDDPTRVARTFALLVPGWLIDRFNALARVRGLAPLAPPVQCMDEFRAEMTAAAGMK